MSEVTFAHFFFSLWALDWLISTCLLYKDTLSPIVMEVENGGLEDHWLVSFWGPFSTSMVMGGRVLPLSTSFFPSLQVAQGLLQLDPVQRCLANRWFHNTKRWENKHERWRLGKSMSNALNRVFTFTQVFFFSFWFLFYWGKIFPFVDMVTCVYSLFQVSLHSLKLTVRPWKWWFPIGISFSRDLFSGAVLVSGRVTS